MRAANIRPLIPTQTKPMEGVIDSPLRFGVITGPIGVFNAKYKLATVLAGKRIVK